MKYKNTTFVHILLIYSHYKPGKPFLKEAPFFRQPPVCSNFCGYFQVNDHDKDTRNKAILVRLPRVKLEFNRQSPICGCKNI